jgi:transposase
VVWGSMLPLMKKRDARSLDHATLEEMRRLAVNRVLSGESQAEVARSLDVHADTVWKWLEVWRREGEAGLASTKATGRPTSLSVRQSERLRGIIVGKNPRQLNFGPALWSLPIIAELVERLFGVVLHQTTISRLLHRLGITPQKPVRRAFQRDDLECLRWMKEEFPGIVRAARRRQATLLFLDETGVHEDGPVGRTWAPRGKTPVVKVTGTRRRANVISAISPRGRLWFRCFSGTLTAPVFVEFLQALLEDFTKPIDVILDRHPAHRAAIVRRFLIEHRRRVRVHYLPGYAPDLNPDEHVWSRLKALFKSDPLEPDEDFGVVVEDTMRKMQRDTAMVKSFFDHPEVAYVKEALRW